MSKVWVRDRLGRPFHIGNPYLWLERLNCHGASDIEILDHGYGDSRPIFSGPYSSLTCDPFWRPGDPFT